MISGRKNFMRTSILWFFFIFIFFAENNYSSNYNLPLGEKSEIIIPSDSNNAFNKSDSESGLIFNTEVEYIQENDSGTAFIQLIGLSQQAQAIQFRLLINKSTDDSTAIIYNNFRKGSDVSDSSWALVYNVVKGPVDSNGASEDEIYVLLYNLDQNGGLPAGDYNDLLQVDYKVIELAGPIDTVKSSFKIAFAQASTSQGLPIDITPSRDELKIYVLNHIILQIMRLVFEKDTVVRLEDDSYTDILQLKGIDAEIQALQFKLLTNQSIDDNVILTFQNIEKGTDVSDPSWVLNYNVIRGPLTGNGGSVDEILVLLYNLNQNSGLPPGHYNDLLRVSYRIADFPALQDSVKSSFLISNAEASTYQGYPVNIIPSRDELTVIAKNRVGYYGDVNGDGCLDILDIIMVVDHIVGRDSLVAEEFARADLAPWITGSPDPEPDGFVNVQDLSLLQNIILTGVYPDGTPINSCSYFPLSKIGSSTGNKITMYVNNKGITMFSNIGVEIRGIQIEFEGIKDSPGNMEINTDLGTGYFKKVDQSLRILLYDRAGQKTIKSGEQLLADIPFHITNPENISIGKIFIIDADRNRIEDEEVEIVYGNPPTIPTDFRLYQNYPNPFNPATTIQYSIPERCNVSIKVYDLLGKEVALLADGQKNRGTYKINFTSNELASGVYIYRIIAGSFNGTKKMLLLK